MKLYANSIIEAEDFSLDTGFVRESNSSASSGALVKSTTDSLASMHTYIEGRQGTYDLVVTYFDETDGSSWSRVKIDGEVVDSWSWNGSSGERNAGPGSMSTRVIENVTLDDLAKITIEGKRDGGEPLRIDSIQLLRPESVVENSLAPAFEGAEGYGAVTQGGNGGTVVKVTNLNDSGEGSLRWALEDLEFPRVVVFEVGGLIELRDQIEVNGDVTVAGQTAPGGVTLTGGRLRIMESDVIIQGLRIRPGDGDGQEARERDSITIGTSERVVERVILDSNSFTWAVDENISIWSNARNITISNNIIAEGLNNSIHPEGSHSMGLLIGDGAERITVTNNLFANNFHRNPQLIGVDKVEFVNNVVSNWGNNGFHTAPRDGEPIRAHVIGNVFLEGDDTSSTAPIRLRGWEDGTKYVVYDNLTPGRKDGDPEIWAIDYDTKQGIAHSGTAFTPSNVTISPSETVVDSVLANVGARTGGELDAIDARIVSDVVTGKGEVVDTPVENVKAIVEDTGALSDRDEDGIPDVYEAALGSDPNRWDPHEDANKDGWSNMLEYFQNLMGDTDGKTAAPAAPVQTDGGGTPASPTAITVEAEDMNLIHGFQVKSNGYAEGDKMIQAGDGDRQVATTVFDGPDGLYDLVIHHFDENDGVSNLRVVVNGEKIDSWKWDDRSGSSLVNEASAAEHYIVDVALQKGDTVKLAGFRDGKEPLRIDAVEFLSADASAEDYGALL